MSKRVFKKRQKEMRELDTTQGNKLVMEYLLTFEISKLIQDYDYDFKTILESRLADIVGEVYQVLWDNELDNETKLRRIYDIYNDNHIHMGETEIRMKRGTTARDIPASTVFKFKKDKSEA